MSDKPATCILLKDGRLFGPFPSAEAAKYWVTALELRGYSTYDLLPPTEEMLDFHPKITWAS